MSGGGGVNILHELWYGNICPSERPIMKDSEYAQALHKAADEKDGLLSSLSSELQKGIERLLDVHMEAAAVISSSCSSVKLVFLPILYYLDYYIIFWMTCEVLIKE